MAKLRFQFRFPGRNLPPMQVGLEEEGFDGWRQARKLAYEDILLTQLKNESGFCEPSVEYETHRKLIIPAVATLYVETERMRAYQHAYQRIRQEGLVIANPLPLDECFDECGRNWLLVEQYEEALAAFQASLEMSEREGPWWPQRLCARHCHLAHVQGILGKKLEQLRTSLKSAAFAVAFKNSTLLHDSSMLYSCSFLNLFLQFSGCKTDQQSVESFLPLFFEKMVQNCSQTWDEHLAERSRTLEEKIVSGKAVISEEDFCFALANFLVHCNRDECRTVLELLNPPSSLSEGESHCSQLAASEFPTLVKLCQMDTLNMTRDCQREGATQPQAISDWTAFASDILQVATLEVSSEYTGWTLSFKTFQFQSVSVCPSVCPWIDIKKVESAASAASSSCEAESSTSEYNVEIVHPEGSKDEELEGIWNQIRSAGEGGKVEDLYHEGRDAAVWIISASTAASFPPGKIRTALLRVLLTSSFLWRHHRLDLAKSMLQDLVAWLLDQPSFQFMEIWMQIVIMYAHVGNTAADEEEQVKCCTKALKVARVHLLIDAEFKLHCFLGYAYKNVGDITKAAKEFLSARYIMTESSALADDVDLVSSLEDAEGWLETRNSQNTSDLDRIWDTDQMVKAVRKLVTGFEELDTGNIHKELEGIWSGVTEPKLSAVVRDKFEDLAHAVRDLAVWIRSPSVGPSYPPENIMTGMFRMREGLKLVRDHLLIRAEFNLHYLFGVTYLKMMDFCQEGSLSLAARGFFHARHIMKQCSALAKDVGCIGLLEGGEGCLEMLKGNRTGGLDKPWKGNQMVEAVIKLEKAVKILDDRYSSTVGEPEYYVKYNWIMTSLQLSDALIGVGNFPRAQFMCNRALEAAKKHRIPFLAALAASTCGRIASGTGNSSYAERVYREGLEQVGAFASPDEFRGILHAGLGYALLMQTRLHEAEDELRKAVKACRQVLVKKNLTSALRVQTFGELESIFKDLLYCLYLIYKEAPESQKGVKVKQALIVAEQGRCRDLMFNLEKHLSENKDTDEDTLDWEKFDSDEEYAWEHLKKCVTVCTDAIRKQNGDVRRVTFVEYTLTGCNMIMWVLHSHGSQEPDSLEATTGLVPEIFSVDLTGVYEFNVVDDFKGVVRETCEAIYGSETSKHYDAMLRSTKEDEARLFLNDKIQELRVPNNPSDGQLNDFYDLLIRPFENKLKPGEPVIFIPHESISSVPFAALKRRSKGKGRKLKEKYFIENHPIGVAPSLRALGWAVNRYATLSSTSTFSQRNRLLLVANPAPIGADKSILKDSETEVDAIAANFPETSTVTLTKREATVKKVTSEMKSTSWFHIACHGEVTSINVKDPRDGDLPRYPNCVLFLTTDNSSPEDKASASNSLSDDYSRKCISGGYLTPRIICDEVKFMQAHAAVLSACQAALGMSRAFMLTGVPLTVAPLRTVDSKLSSLFMQRLYKKLVAGESMMFALRNTMLDVIEEKWHLWDWAAWLPEGFPGVCLPLQS